MYKNKTILLLIPARAGSKGLPGKNIVKLGGMPLIAHSIIAGKNSKLADKVLVSTDSPQIRTITLKYGADAPFLRPAELAADTSATVDVVMHALDWLGDCGEKYDAVGLLEPTSPLRKTKDIDNAIKLLVKNWNTADAVISLGKIGLEHPFLTKTLKQDRVKPFFPSSIKAVRRQELPPAFFPYGVIYLCKTSTIRKKKTFYPKRIVPYFIERWQNYEVDDIFDLVAIRAEMRHAKKQKYF